MKLGIYKAVPTLIAVALWFLAIGRTPAGASKAAAAAPDTRPDVATLRQERLATLREAGDIAERQYASGTGTYEQVERVDRMLIDAEVAAANTPKQAAEILNNAVKRARQQESIARKRLEAGAVTALDSLEAKAFRLSLELQIRLREEHVVDDQHR
jgi:outer membrane protein TolC